MPVPKPCEPSQPPATPRGRARKKEDGEPRARSKSAPRARLPYCFDSYKKGECSKADCKFRDHHIPAELVDQRIKLEKEENKEKKEDK